MAYNQTNTVQATLADGTLTQATLASGTIAITVQNQAYSANNYYPTGTIEFPALDLSKYLNGTPSITLASTLPSGTALAVYTQTSSDNVTFSSWALLNNDNTISSTSARYLKIKLFLSATMLDQTSTVNTFNASETSQFDKDNQTNLDGSLYLKTTYDASMTKDTTWSGSGAVFTYTINRSEYTSIESLTVT